MQVCRFAPKFTPAATLAATLALTAGMIAGCDRSSANASAIAHSSAKLQSNSGGAFSASWDGISAKNYKDSIQLAKPVADAEGKNPHGAAASALVGESQLGQAQAILDQASVAEQAALDKVSLIRVRLSNWVAYNAEADAASSFDPKEMVAQIDANKAEREKEIQAYTTQQQDLQRRLADLQAKAKARFEEAAKLGEEYSKARESLGSLSASEAEAKLTAARESKRKGDAIRVEASRLQAQADVLQPEITEIGVLIEATKNRLAGLDRAKLELNEKAQQGRAAAAQSRTSAGETAKDIEAALAELASFRNAEVNSKFDNAISTLRTALASAKSASGDPAGPGKLLVGRVQLALAGAQAAKASSLAIYASLLQQAETVTPALPFASSIGAPQKEAADLSKASVEEAKSAYEGAQSAFSSIQLKGPGGSAIKERMTLLSDALGILAGKQEPSQAPAAPAPAAAPESAPAAPEAPPAAQASGSGDAPAAWEQIYGAMESGNKEVFFSLVKLQDPAHKEVLEKLVSLTVMQSKLDAACKDKFGKTLSEAQAAATGMTAPTKASDYKVEVTGDSAVISHPGSPAPLKLVQDNGKWLLDSSSIATGPISMAAQMSGPISAAMESVTVDVQGGKITKIEDVVVELQKRVMGGAKSGGN